VAFEQGIRLKKKFGQHFLKEQWVIDNMLQNVDLNETSSVFEIGGGSGFLTRAILKTKIARLWVFEIDSDWVNYLQSNIKDKRLTVHHENILDLDFDLFKPYQPWTLLANLPYQITFPILYKIQENRALIKEGVIMVQEEVAQKILKQSGKDYGYVSLFFQHYFDWKLLDKISPAAFNPPPKVYSRLLYFKPKQILTPIKDEENFWKFVKICFRQPRRTLRNNLIQAHYNLDNLDHNVLNLRAQQIDMVGLLNLWNKIDYKP